jgi:hypothetical protein
MKALKSIFVLFVISMALALTQCGGATEPVVSDQGNTEPIYVVMADEHLQTGHKEAILRALNAWATDTHNTFAYQLTFVDMSKEPANLDAPYTIKIYVKDPGPGYLGWTTWSSNHASFTFVEPSIDAELFRRIMLHELGHSFALSFDGDPHYKGPYKSVMHPSIGEDSLHLSCPELQAFCNAYNCQVDCTNVAQGAVAEDVAWKETCE